jgi:hypothetical protein
LLPVSIAFSRLRSGFASCHFIPFLSGFT